MNSAFQNKSPLPVRVVKQNFLNDGEDAELHQTPVEGGELRPTGVSSPGHQVVNPHRHGPRDEHVVEDDGLQGLTQLHRIHLQGDRIRAHMKQILFLGSACSS